MKKLVFLSIILLAANDISGMQQPTPPHMMIMPAGGSPPPPPPPGGNDYIIEIAKMAASLAQIPDIVMGDSSNATSLRVSSGLTLASVLTKTTYDLIRKRKGSRLIKDVLYDFPKTAAYAWCMAYDIYKIKNAQELAAKNKSVTKKDLRLKIGQSVLLAVELFLRTMATIKYKQNDTTTAVLSSEAADLIEISRLLTRPAIGSPLENLLEKNQKLFRSLILQKNTGPSPE